jgi:hypothetical protein
MTAGPVPDAVTVTALPAACGDCLVVEYAGADGPHRLVVDGGLSSAYERGLGAYLAGVVADGAHGPGPAAADVLVVTHVDRDHIDGAIRALRDGHLAAADIWFNGRDEIAALIEGNTRGVRQGDELSALIPVEVRNRVVEGRALHVPDTGPLRLDLPGGAVCTLLSPTAGRLERLLDKWPEPVRDVPDPTEDLLDVMEDPRTRGEGEFGEDSSVANGSSIAFLLEANGVSLLLVGDAFADDLETSIRQLLASRGEPRLTVDLFKLSHHGSRQNMTDGLLALVAPRSVLVCTDGSKFRHPDEDALAKVREHYPDVPIHFTDDTDHIRQRAALVGSAPPAATPVRLAFTPPGQRQSRAKRSRSTRRRVPRPSST